jgi:DNA-binding SARP family transcriptional activator
VAAVLPAQGDTAPVEFGILGPLVVWRDGREVRIGAAKQRALLMLLLLRRGELVPTETLVEQLWGERPPATAAKAVQVYVSQLRKTLGEGLVETRPGGYTLRVEPGALDAARFEDLLARSRNRVGDGEAGEVLREALDLWRGPPLEEFRYEAFARDEIARLEELRLEALEERLELDLVLGSHGVLVGELQALAAEYPLRERLHGQLMLALYRAGRQAEALGVYQQLRRVLVEELGIEPSTSIRQLERAILAQDAALDPPAAGARKPADADAGAGEEAAGAPAAGRAEVRVTPGRALRELKVVTVVCCDTVDSAAGSGVEDPEVAQERIESYHQAARRSLERFGGRVEVPIGDSLIAVFGAPLAHEDDSERAVRAGLALIEAIEELNDSGLEHNLSVRVGIGTGEAVVSLAARPEQGEVMVSGQVVSVAADLQAAAPANSVLVAEATFRATRDAIEYRERERVPSKKRKERLAVWEAVAVRPQRGFGLAGRAPGSFVGRANELDLLVDALARARRERSPQLVTLIGVPGIGKSRLVAELAAYVRAQPDRARWLQGRSPPYGEGVTFSALGETVKAQAGILESDAPEQAGRKLHDAAGEPWIESHLRPLVGLPAEAQLGGDDRRIEAFAAWRQFFESLADERPLVLVFEDLHWSEEAFLDFVDYLVDWASGVPLLVVCTARPELLERRTAWGGGKSNAVTISLSPLPDEDTAQLIGDLLDEPLPEEAVRAALLARAGGNPLYAEQYARVLLERGELTELPEAVQGIIAARIDLLEPEEKTLLQDAAVLGETFSPGGLASVSGLERRTVERGMHALERKHFLRQERGSPRSDEPQYLFLHMLVRDVAYRQMPRAERADRHQRAAAWIESLGGAEDRAELLAHHYVRALELAGPARLDISALTDSARRALRDAGERAAALYAVDAAERFYDAALELWPEDDPERAQLLFRRAAPLGLWAGEDPGRLTEAMEALLVVGDTTGAAEAEMLLSQTYRMQGRGDLADQHADSAAALVAGAAPSRSKTRVLARRAHWEYVLGRYERALEIGSEARAVGEQAGAESLSEALTVVGSARVGMGDPAGLEDEAKSIELATAAGALVTLSQAHNSLAANHQTLGDLQAAYAARLEGASIAERLGSAAMIRWFQGVFTDHRYRRGEWGQALQMADEFLAGVEAGNPHHLAWQVFAIRGEIRLARGDRAAAIRDAERALAAGRATAETCPLYFTLASSAHVLSTASRREQATSLAGEFLEALHRRVPLGYAAINLPTFTAAARRLDLSQELVDALAAHVETPWTDAARRYARGDFAGAAELLYRSGARPAEAEARLRAAEQLVADGRPGAAADPLRRALAFYRSVGAIASIREGERLLAAAK